MAKDKITRCNAYMFQKVRCKSYMKRINDGRCIELIPGSETESGRPSYFYIDNKAEDEADRAREVPIEDWGGDDFVKTYYELTEREFVGIVIGLKMVTVKAELFCDTAYGYDSSERDYVGKEPVEKVKVAVVAYGCNRTRLVPLGELEIMEKADEED